MDDIWYVNYISIKLLKGEKKGKLFLPGPGLGLELERA